MIPRPSVINTLHQFSRILHKPPIQLSRTLHKPLILTDISLLYSHESPIDQFHKIITNHRPHKIQLTNESLYDYATQYFKKRGQSSPVMIVPSPKSPAKYPVVSYKTSISSIYQIKRENITLEETRATLKYLTNQAPTTYKRLYVECLTECPYSGPIDVDYTLYELCQYHKYGLDEIILCDTCGKLDYESFRYLVTCLIYFGIPKSRIGFQFRLTADFPYIRRYAQENGLIKWDVVDSPVHKKERPISYKDIYLQTI